MTFSKSLADRINTLCADQYLVQRTKFKVGRTLTKGEKSESGLYAILSSKGRLLRIALSQEMAEELCDWDSRYLAECWVGGAV